MKQEKLWKVVKSCEKVFGFLNIHIHIYVNISIFSWKVQQHKQTNIQNKEDISYIFYEDSSE